MPASTEYYDTLGVSHEASADEIKKAFRRRAREVHPDTSDDPTSDDAEFKRLNEAYEVLSDPEKRANYDRFGTADPRRGGGYPDSGGFGVDIGDIFSVFFDGVNQAGATPRREGRDMAVQVVVTLREAADGVDREVAYDRDAPCDRCEGSGAAPGGEVKTCPSCDGTGQQVSARRTFLGSFQSVHPCPTCGAMGTIVEPACDSCRGTGRAPKSEKVIVTVPPGVEDGQQIVVEGQGEAGIRGARTGRLIVQVRIRPHEFLHREGADLHCRADVPMVRAALGGDVTIEGLRGPVVAHVPAGTQNGDTVVVRGEGMPRSRGGAGDLVVHANVTVPKKLSKKQRAALEDLAADLGDPQKHSTMHRIRDWLGG